jgi:hypothetical protein
MVSAKKIKTTCTESPSRYLIVRGSSVNMPGATKGMLIYEDLGIGEVQSDYNLVLRGFMSIEVWDEVSVIVKREFNTRLAELGLKKGSWAAKEISLDRWLGQELCLLAWATQGANNYDAFVAVRNWLRMSPEERYWLFKKAYGETGLHHEKMKGWRLAVINALCNK